MNKTVKSFSILACISLMMLLGSCEQKAIPSQENLQEESAFDALQQEIASFDAQFQNGNDAELRGFWSDLWAGIKEFFSDCGAVVVADVVGLTEDSSMSVSIGSDGKLTPSGTINIGKAVSSSVKTAKEVFSTSRKSEQKESWGEWRTKPSYSIEYTGSIVGEAHNEIIKELCELYKGKELDDVSDEQMYQDILKLTLKYYNVSPNAVDKNAWKELQTSAEKVCSDVANKTPEEAIAYLRAYSRGDKRELNIIADYLVKVKSLPTEKLRKEYAKGFSERVKLSSITEQSKQTIMNATATGLNSIALWERK